MDNLIRAGGLFYMVQGLYNWLLVIGYSNQSVRVLTVCCMKAAVDRITAAQT